MDTTLIKNALPNLSELELIDILESIAEVVEKNKLQHLIDQAFSVVDPEEINNLQEEYDILEKNLNALQEQAVDTLNELKDARARLSEFEDARLKIKLLVA